ncbi:MAG: M48 family metalloprotease [Candidatus Pacebacteria bacterium]|nr:M48 family metalloprotease [Candidatus Paceibacterota bacterium]
MALAGNLYKERSSNVFRTWLMMTIFLIVVIAIGYFISWYYDSSVILYIAVAFAIGMNFYSYWFSDKQVLSMTNARPATREEFFDFYTVTENLAITAGIPMPKLYVISDPSPNAFSTGRDEKHAVVCATTGLLAIMNRQELEGVVSHELSHIRNRDILLMTCAVVLAGFIAIIADIFLRVSFWGGGRRDDNSNGGALLFVFAIIAMILAPLAAQLIQLAISRRREYLADASGALLTRYPEGLASALQKIGSAQPMRNPSHATAHLFIGDPFGPKPRDWIDRLFSTHPPIQDRIRALLGASAG